MPFKVGYQPAIRLRIEVKRCANVYGQSPCTASGTDALRCFNTINTCQDIPNYRKATHEYKFCSSGVFLDGYMPVIKSYRKSAPQLSKKFDIWKRLSISITLDNFIGNDTNQDDPYKSGRVIKIHDTSWWDRFRQRNKFLNGSPAVFEEGYVNEMNDFVPVTAHHIFVKTINYNQKTTVIEFNDGLEITEKKGAQVPAPSEVLLYEDLNETATEIKINKPFKLDSSGKPPKYISIAPEIMEATAQRPFRPEGAAPDSTPIYWILDVVRGVEKWGSEILSHDNGDSVQDCYYHENRNVADIVEDLLKFTNIERFGIKVNREDFDLAKRLLLENYNLTGIVVKPTGVDKLLSKLQKDCGMIVFYDEVEKQMNLKTLEGLSIEGNNQNELQQDGILRNSFRFKDKLLESLSRVLIFCAPNNYADTSNDTAKYRFVIVGRNEEIEGEDYRNTVSERKIYSEWLNRAQAILTARRYLEAGGDNEGEVSVDVPIDFEISLGDNLPIYTDRNVDSYGNKGLPYNIRILRIDSINSEKKRLVGRRNIFGDPGQTYARYDISVYDGADVYII